MYYRNAQAAVVVYDVTKASSLDKAKSWVKELQHQANPNIVIALAGNKVDLVEPLGGDGADASGENEDEPDDATATPGEAAAESLREVPTAEAAAYAEEAGLLFFETSAKTGKGIVEIFTEIGMTDRYGILLSYLTLIDHQRKRFRSSKFLRRRNSALAEPLVGQERVNRTSTWRRTTQRKTPAIAEFFLSRCRPSPARFTRIFFTLHAYI